MRDRRLWVALAVGLLLIAVVLVAVAANSQGSGPTLAVAGASAAPSSSARADDNRNGKDHGKGFKVGKPDQALKGIGSADKGPITITAIDGVRLSLATEDGWTRTITTTAATVITKDGQTITVGALKVGDEIRFRQTRAADGSYTIESITVPTPVAGGEVTAVGAGTITVKGRGGATRVITVTGSTVYKLGSAAGTKADVAVGSKISAQGTVDDDTFTAITVLIAPPSLDGVVTAKTADTITVKRGDGTTGIIHVSADTKYAIKGNQAAKLADIAVGARVNAVGRQRADGSLDAAAVRAHPVKPLKPAKQPAASKAPGG
jgi:hypothetical protein